MTDTSFHTRINNHALSLGMVRYSTGNKDTDDYLWKFVISNHCGSEKIIQIEASVEDFRKMITVLNNAISCLETDGRRKTKE